MSKWTDLAQYHGGHDAVCGPNRARQVPGASEWGWRWYWYVCGRCGAGHAVRRAVTNTYCYAQGDSYTTATSDTASSAVTLRPYGRLKGYKRNDSGTREATREFLALEMVDDWVARAHDQL